MVFQAYALFPNLTVAAERRLRPEGRRACPRPRPTARVAEMLELIGLPRARRPLSRSSSRAASSSAWRWPARWRRSRSVLLLDEPLSALDAKVRVSLRDEIRAIQKRARHHHDLRHPRPGRGAVDLRPHRRDEWRHGRAGRHAVRDLQPPDHALRRQLRRHAEHARRHGDRSRRRARCASATTMS